jgi:hypothetical protein
MHKITKMRLIVCERHTLVNFPEADHAQEMIACWRGDFNPGMIAWNGMVEARHARCYHGRAVSEQEDEPTMNWGALLVLMAVFAALMLIVQRAERKRRLFTLIVMLIGAELVRRYLVYRGWDTEGLLAVLAALILNGLFWLFIGRNNPPKSSDEIEVWGND